MAIRIFDRRHNRRHLAAYPIDLKDACGRVVVHGRTTNLSECGASVLARLPGGPPAERDVLAALNLPPRHAGDAQRIVKYRGRIVGVDTLGKLTCMGVKFLEKIA